MNNKVDVLLKGYSAEDSNLTQSKKYINTKNQIIEICKSLDCHTKAYNSGKTLSLINSYLSTEDRLGRILYSEISNYVFSLDIETRGMFATNIEKLLIQTLESEDSSTTDDCSKIVIKIYDHCQLSLKQIENIKGILGEGIEETKIDLRSEVKSVEKEYISILGIFAAIVLAFVGGITFSSSILENINAISVFRLLIVVDMLAFVLMNVIWMLIRFILQINDKDIKLFKIRTFNIICGIIAILVILAWVLNATAIADFLSSRLPWCN